MPTEPDRDGGGADADRPDRDTPAGGATAASLQREVAQA
jgi:hypothetical protein